MEAASAGDNPGSVLQIFQDQIAEFGEQLRVANARIAKLEDDGAPVIRVDLSKTQLASEVLKRRRGQGQHMHVPFVFDVFGSGDQDTVPFYPGMRIRGMNTWPGMSQMNRREGMPLFKFPDELRQGGGGSGFAYGHHCKVDNVRFNGAPDRFPLLDLYNGGFGNIFDQCLLTKNGGPGFIADRTLMNTVFIDTDASQLEGLGRFNYDSTVGKFHWLRGQIDDCGPEPFKASQSRKGGLPSSLDMIIIDGPKWEHHDATEPAQSFFAVDALSQANNLNVVLREINANLSHAVTDFAFYAESSTSRKARPSVVKLESIRFRAGKSSRAVLAKMVQGGHLGCSYSDETLGCDDQIVLGPKAWQRY